MVEKWRKQKYCGPECKNARSSCVENLGRGMLGRKHTLETKQKMSLRAMGNPGCKGEKSHFWKGGITSENQLIRSSAEFAFWRKSVFERDGWTCQECKEWGGRLHSHHIKPFASYPNLRFDVDNGETLCKKCHRARHRRVG